MWHEDGLSIEKIANFPGRSAPIKEGTVLSYLLEAVQEGFEIDWPRLCDEIELTSEMLASITNAVKKVGSTEKMKPIKDELPENISYSHLRTALTLISCGISSLTKPVHSENTNEVLEPELEPESSVIAPTKRSCDYDQTLAENGMNEAIDLSLCNPDTFSSKRSKVDRQEIDLTGLPLEATQTSVLELIKNSNNGVL